jgi:GNAT superfamily N-acetyltransferase
MAINTITTFELKTDVFPDVPGLTFRGFQGEPDYKILHDIMVTCFEADQIEEEYTLEDITRQYNNVQRCNLYTDMIFAEIDGEVIGYGRCWWNQEVSGDYVYPSFIHLLPEWRGTGIGLAMVKHLHARIQIPPNVVRRHRAVAF